MDYCFAHALNDLGQVAGSAAVPGQHPSSRHACLWLDPLTPVDLHQVGHRSDAYSINNAGQVVGRSLVPPGLFDNIAFLYACGRWFDLNSLIAPGPYFLRIARRVNNRGEILVDGTRNIGGAGHGRRLLLRPNSA